MFPNLITSSILFHWKFSFHISDGLTGLQRHLFKMILIKFWSVSKCIFDCLVLQSIQYIHNFWEKLWLEKWHCYILYIVSSSEFTNQQIAKILHIFSSCAVAFLGLKAGTLYKGYFKETIPTDFTDIADAHLIINN